MARRQILKICGAILIGVAAFGLSNDRGSANVDPDDRKLRAFIEAAAAVEDVMALWQPRIARADQNQTLALRHQANIDIRESIEKIDGISLAEYREIRQEIAADPEVLARVTEIMRQRH